MKICTVRVLLLARRILVIVHNYSSNVYYNSTVLYARTSRTIENTDSRLALYSKVHVETCVHARTLRTCTVLNFYVLYVPANAHGIPHVECVVQLCRPCLRIRTRTRITVDQRTRCGRARHERLTKSAPRGDAAEGLECCHHTGTTRIVGSSYAALNPGALTARHGPVRRGHDAQVCVRGRQTT